jgi:hypothetical protein
MNAISPSLASSARPVQYPTPGASLPNQVSARAMAGVAQLGTQTRLLMNGSVLYNEPLVQQLVQMGPMVVPALQNFFMSVNSIPALVEGLYVAEKLAERGVDTTPIAQSTARWNSHPDPLVQMNLARFYRKINNPGTFGPMMATLINQAVNQYASLSSPNYNVSQEVGETVLNQIANRTADVVLQRLTPLWQALALQQAPQSKK